MFERQLVDLVGRAVCEVHPAKEAVEGEKGVVIAHEFTRATLAENARKRHLKGSVDGVTEPQPDEEVGMVACSNDRGAPLVPADLDGSLARELERSLVPAQAI